ncbi:MAG: MerR family DNA-binding transcriptional regulator [Phycisphaeraceae bacterium]|nr:MerR family DNA-binding transcriptional regulator [Phycisphaeraceae bacterium]
MPKHSSEKPDLLNIGEAASLLGVSVSTLRNWDRGKKLAARRHPINGYRLYDRAELMALIQEIKGIARAAGKGGRR